MPRSYATRALLPQPGLSNLRFRLFKRGIVGSYHKMSRDHMDSYLQEFCWRFNRRHMQPYLFDILLGELAGHKPLTYRGLLSKSSDVQLLASRDCRHGGEAMNKLVAYLVKESRCQ